MYSLDLIVPGNPQSLNQMIRTNHYRNYKNKKNWEQVVWYLSKGKEPRSPLERYDLSLTRHSWRMMDFDGLVASFKPLVDGLIVAGIIKNDGWQNSGPWRVNQVFRSKKLGTQIEIHVREIAN